MILPLVFWDASALVKRYGREVGSPTVDAIFSAVPRTQMFGTLWGYAETFAILHRKRNDGRLDAVAHAAAVTSLQNEVLTPGDFRLLAIEEEHILLGLSYVTRHNLNSADAAILAAYVRYRQSLPQGSPGCVLVAADGRLLRAAQAEGFAPLNPQNLAAADLPAFLATVTMITPPGLVLRPLEAADIEPIAAAFRALGWDKPASQYERYLAEQNEGRRAVLVALLDGTFAGYLTVNWHSEYPPFRQENIPEIQDFNVLPHYRRQGIGTHLMDAAERLIAARRARRRHRRRPVRRLRPRPAPRTSSAATSPTAAASPTTTSPSAPARPPAPTTPSSST